MGPVVTPDAGSLAPAQLDPHVFGEAYEHFVARVYMIAIGLGSPTRSGLRSAGLREEAIATGTAELVARGLLEETSDPDTWEVPSPQEAISRNADRMERRISMARATAAEVDGLWRRAVGERLPRTPTGLQMLVGAEEIVRHLTALHRAATSRLWLALDGSPACVHMLEQAEEDASRLAVREGTDVRVVLDTSLLDNAAALAHVGRCRAAGHHVSVANGLPFTLGVADTTVGLVDLTSHDPAGEGSCEIRLAPPVRALVRLHEEIWGLATPYIGGLEGVLEDEQRLPVPERDRQILALLTTGASDKVIARQTGVSVRTVERRVRWLMDHLGAATRFQAGVQAARRGWI